MISFVVYGVPQPKGSAKAFMPKGWTRPIITSDNKGVKAWEAVIRGEAQTHAGKTFWTSEAIEIGLDFYPPRPVSLPKRVRACTKKPDLDKLARSAIDALTGVLFHDDAQVTKIAATKQYAVDSPPRVEVTLGGIADALALRGAVALTEVEE